MSVCEPLIPEHGSGFPAETGVQAIKQENETLMKSPDFELFYVNKYSWPAQDPMTSVTTMLLYSLAKRGVAATLIAEGDQREPADPLLKERFGLAPIATFRVQRFKRFLFGKVRLTELFFLKAIFFILRTRSRKRPVIVMTRNTTFLPWLVGLRRLFGLRVVFESHAYHGRCVNDSVVVDCKQSLFSLAGQFDVIERMFLNSTNALVCQSELQRELYVKDFVRVPTAVIPLGSQIYEHDGPKDPRPANRRCIAYIGSYIGWVDADLMFRALALEPCARTTLLWIGLPDSEAELLREKARGNGVAERCDLRGWMGHASMIRCLRAGADAGIVLYKPTQLTGVHVSPTKIFDYFAAGLPVIGPDLPSVMAHVAEGREGVLYKTGDAISLAAAIERLFCDPVRYETWRACAAEAAKKCSWDNRAAQFVEFANNKLLSSPALRRAHE